MGKAKKNTQRVLITGGSGDIGMATAKRYLAAGGQVMLVDIDEKALKKAKKSFDNKNVFIEVADVTKPKQVEAYVNAAVKKMGGIDVFFNNAGIEGPVQSIIKYSLEDFKKVIDVNVVGVWLGLKYAMAAMKDGGGSIIITSSVAGQGGTPGVSGYVASKHATIGLMRVAALEGAKHGIRVNTIHPSPVEGRMMQSLEDGLGGEGVKKSLEQQIPLGRYAEQSDVADLVYFLGSKNAKFLTGGQFNVDGGMSAL